MRIYLEKVPKELYLYKKKELIVGNSKNKLKGNLIVPLCSSPNDLFDVYKSNIFVNQNIRGYFHPRLEKLSSVRKKPIRNIQKQHYEEIRNSYSKLAIKKTALSSYNDINTYFNMYEYYRLFEETFGSFEFTKKTQLFQTFLKEVLSKTTSYENVIVHIRPRNMISTSGRIFSYENIFYFLAKNNLLDVDFFSRFTFIVSDIKATMFFKVTFGNKSDKFDLERFRKFSNIIYKIDNNISLDKTELEAIEVTDEEIIENDSLKKEQPTLQMKELNKTPESKNMINGGVINKTHNIEDIPESIAKSNTVASKVTSKKQNITDDIPKPISKSSIDEEDEETSDSFDDMSDFFDDIDFEEEFEENTIDQKKVAKLKEKQEKVTVIVKDNKTKKDVTLSIDKVIADRSVNNIDVKPIKIDTLNEEVKKSTLKDMDRSYVEYQKDKDMYKVISAFNEDPECAVYITGIEREDTSDSFNKKETLTINYEDSFGKKHTVKVDVPIIIDNSFMFLNNGKKAISKQLNLLPILKLKPDEVKITTNYSKLHINRTGKKLNNNIDKLKKFITKELTKYKDIEVVQGSNKGVNSKYVSTLEYDEISEFLISFRLGTLYLNFNRVMVNDEILNNSKFDVETVLSESEFALGVDKSTRSYFVIDSSDDDKIKEYTFDKALRQTYDTIYELLLTKIKIYSDDAYTNIINQKTSKVYVYTTVSILNHNMPLIILLGFYYGLEKVLNRYNVAYEFTEKKKVLTEQEQKSLDVIQFSDGYLYYSMTPLRNSILLKGLSKLNTREFSFTSLNKKEGYIEVFDLLFNNRQIGKGINNFLSLLLDPITKEVLEDLKLPTNLLDIFLYTNTLLENNTCSRINDLHNYRVRSIELINDHLYLLLANAVKQYKDMHKAGRKEAKISVRQDALIKTLMESAIIDEYSILNPVLEIEKLGSTNYKGLGGTELDSAFTPSVRAYDKSMIGMIGMSSPDSNKVGVVRQLSYDPKILNARGIIDFSKETNEFEATNLFSAGELLSCYTSLHADPPQQIGALHW